MLLIVICVQSNTVGRILYIQGQSTDPFFIRIAQGIKDGAKVLNMEVIVNGPLNWSPEEQISVLEKELKKKPDLILISPTSSKQMIAPLKKVYESGIPIITLDTYIEDGKYQDGIGDGDFPVLHISSDNVYGGRLAAQQLAKQINGKGTVLVIKGSPASTTQEREYGFKLEMRRHPGIHILKTGVCNENLEKAKQILIDNYTAHPNIVGVFGADLYSAIGASQGINELKKSSAINVVAFDATKEIVAFINNKQIGSAIAQHPHTIGMYGAMSAYSILTNNSAPVSINTGFTIIDSSNISSDILNTLIY